MKKIEAELLKASRPGPDYFLHTYFAPELSKASEPGQFVEIRVGDGPHPILRRPFSISFAQGETIQVLFKVVGEGTRLLSMKKKGTLIDIIGPIGTPFEIEEKPAVLVAGGIGCAPLYFLAARLREAGREVAFLYGARAKNDLVLLQEIAGVADELKTTTEDGSLGTKGLITDLLLPFLIPDYAIYACGPESMLIALQKMLAERRLEAQFSLENYMACGVGACQGCSIETTRGFRRVCVDGPVFSSGEIVSFPFSPRLKQDVCGESRTRAPIVNQTDRGINP